MKEHVRSRVTYRHPAVIGTAISVVVVVLLVFVIDLDVIENIAGLGHVVGSWIRQHGWSAALGLLYAEESGVPMPVPGDLFLMYAGHQIRSHPQFWVLAWLGFIAVVTLGATNLYWISRKWGRPLVMGRVGRAMHITPRKVRKAEVWFQRYGVFALIFGRHIIGLRVPITVAAGVLRIRYRVFAASVAVSTAVWAAVFLSVGIKYGGSISGFVGVHRWLYIVVPAVLVTAFVVFLIRGLLSQHHPEDFDF
jgi:membrane protein DedA with SNARE-associated domain